MMKKGLTASLPASPKKAQPNRFQGISIDLDRQGLREYTKISFPVKYGCFSRLETPEAIFEFNLNHEIRHARSKQKTWLHPSEWLKRTMGNDWVYYSSGGYAGVFEAIGEYYLPNLTYPTNSLLGGKPFEEAEIRRIITCWPDILADLPGDGLTEAQLKWLYAVRENTPEILAQKARALTGITGSRITVMPPDARHVDYNIIPLTLADGCLYKCPFCRVKNKKAFSVRPSSDIQTQITALKSLYGKDLVNYNALFLGEHDALNTPSDILVDTAASAYEGLGFAGSVMQGCFLFLFGSVDSFLSARDDLFSSLQALPFHTFINIGLESCDKTTLDLLGKPLSPEMVVKSFQKAAQINDTWSRVEITCNFVMDESLPLSHFTALKALIGQSSQRKKPKGCIYLSPLKFGHPSREILYDFYKLKALSRFPTFLYIIQRL